MRRKHYLATIVGDHLALGFAELKSIVDGDEWVQDGAHVRFESDKSTHSWERLGLTREVLVKKDISEVAHGVRVRLENRSSRSKAEVFREVLALLGSPLIDLEHPDRVFVVCDDGIYETVWVREKGFELRRNHLLAHPHPTGLHPKVARAMINVSGARKEVCDPFCGAGGILLEASLMGLHTKGSDIDDRMIVRTKENLEQFGVRADLRVADALTQKWPSEVVVTDLPYGRSSKTSKDVAERFLEQAHHYAPVLVVGFNCCLREEDVIARGWTLREVFELRAHRSLTRYVHVLIENTTSLP